MSSNYKYILVVDDEEEITVLIEIALRMAYKNDILTASSGNKAIDLIKQKGTPEIIISDYSMDDGDGASLFNYIQNSGQITPFIVCSAISKNELLQVFKGAYGFVEKPMIIKPIIQLVQNLTRGATNPNDYVAIPLHLFSVMSALPYNIHLKLSDSNIVLLYKKGDALVSEDLVKLRDKGVQELLLTQNECLGFLTAYEENLAVKMSTEKDPEKIVSLAFDSLTLIPKLAIPLGWNQEFLDFAKKNMVQAIHALAKDIELKRIIKEKLSDPSTKFNKHIFLNALISCTFCNYMGFTTDAAHMKMAMASVLHDMFVDEKVYQNIKEWNKLAQSKTDNSPEMIKYKNHPLEAANYIRSVKNLPADIDQIVLQHEERPDGSGFPRGLSSSTVSVLSCLFIMTEDFVNHLLESSSIEKAIEDFIRGGESYYNTGNFKKIFNVLKSKLQATSLNSSI